MLGTPITPPRTPRFRFFRWPHPWGWEWQLHLGPFAVWGGFEARMSIAADVGIDTDRIHVHFALLWLWISASLWWPRRTKKEGVLVALGYLKRLMPMPMGWTVEDEKLHAGCEYADERTMPPLPPKITDESLARWCNDLCATHERGDMGRMVYTLIARSVLGIGTGAGWEFGCEKSTFSQQGEENKSG